MEITATAIQVLLAIVFIFAGATKLIGLPMQLENFERYGYPPVSRVLTGTVEAIGAAGMVGGLFADGIAIAAGTLLGATMVGAVYTDLKYSPRGTVIAPLVLLVLCVAVVALRIAD